MSTARHRAFPLLLLAALGIGPRDGRAQEPSPPPTFPADVQVVTVDVLVLDRKGVPVSGLLREDFMIEEDDRAQEVEQFQAIEGPPEVPAGLPGLAAESAYPPVHFVILFDELHLTLGGALLAKAGLRKFLDTRVREGERVTLVAGASGNWWSGVMTADRDDLLGRLESLRGRLLLDGAPPG